MLSESERRIKILDYVRQNSLDNDPKITKSDVMRYMKDSRMMTTHKTTIELLKEGKIKMVKPKDKPYSKIDYLVINEENEFNKIYDQLSEIEKITLMMDEPAEKIMSLGFPDKAPDRWIVRELRENFLGSFEGAMRQILDFLLLYTSHKINSEKDSWLIYTRIIRLILKTEEQESVYTVTGIERKSHMTETSLWSYIRDLKSVASQHKEFAINNDIKNINLLSNLIETTIKKFKKEFLK